MAKRIDTKRALIDATVDLLRQTDDFTVKEIAQKSFTNIAAVNYHFGDKNTLVDIALSEIVEIFRQRTISVLDISFDTSEDGMEYVLSLVLDFYAEYKGAVKHAILNNDVSGTSKFISLFLLDQDFMDSFLARISKITGETNRDILLYKYMIAVSAFLLPVLSETNNVGGKDKFSLSSLQNEYNRKLFIAQIMKTFQ